MRAKSPIERLIHDRRQLLNALAVYRRGHGPDLPPEEMELVVTGLEQRIARLDAMIDDVDEA
jgi:hypothetical protein